MDEDDGNHLRAAARSDSSRISTPSWWASIQNRRLKAMPTPSRNYWKALLLGQMIALLMASMNAASYTLVSRFNVQTQLFQMFFFYLLLVAFLSKRHAPTSASGERFPVPYTSFSLRAPWWVYGLCSVLDICPNFLALLSLKYTSLTSATLLGSLTVPSTMFFTRLVLGKTFRPVQYVGVCLCVVGGILTVLSDSSSSEETSMITSNTTAVNDSINTYTNEAAPLSHHLLGDAMAITAAICYGLGDTLAEYFVKHVEREEYLGMLGFYGVLFTGLSFPILEHEALYDLMHQTTLALWCIAGVFCWYVASVFLYYTTEATFLISSDATLLNLSLQAANLWTVLFSVLVDGQPPPSNMFFVAALLVVSGVFVYEVIPRSTNNNDGDPLEHFPTILAQEDSPEDEDSDEEEDDSAEGDVEEVNLQERWRRSSDSRDGTSGVFRLPTIQLSS